MVQAIATPHPDAQLLARARAGEFQAFEELVSRHERRVYATAMGILRHREDAEDVTQTVFLNAFEHLPGFRGEAAFSTWVTRIAVNTALKALRKRKGLKVTTGHGGAETEDGTIPHPEFIAPWRDDPVRIVEQRHLRRALDDAVARLPDNHRLVFILRDVEDLSVRETARALGISEANVKVRLLRARLALREKLTRLFGDESRRAPKDHSHEGQGDRTPAADLLRSYRNRARTRP
jgi:RNA polymerase sigma-70 factor (ECF subfamily)